jgi:hypothetical protein
VVATFPSCLQHRTLDENADELARWSLGHSDIRLFSLGAMMILLLLISYLLI